MKKVLIYVFSREYESVQMSEIASLWNKSEEELQSQFEDKNRLYCYLIDQLSLHLLPELHEPIVSSKNAVKLFYNICQQLCFRNEYYFYPFIKDSYIYKPDLYKYFCKVFEARFSDKIQSVLLLGVEQEMFRSNLNIELSAKLFLHIIINSSLDTLVHNEDFLEKIALKKLTDFYIQGLCSPKGKSIINQLVNQ